MASLNESDLKKKAVFLGLEDVLIPGDVDKEIDLEKVKEILSNLQGLEKQFPSFHYYLLTGHREDATEKMLKEHGLEGFFKKESILSVNDDYVKEKEKVDRERYEENLAKDPGFKDEYFKQVAVEKIRQELGCESKDMILIGHELISEAFYTMRFSKIDFAIIEPAQSYLNKKFDEKIEGIIYIKREWPDFRKLILGEKGEPNLAAFEKMIFKKLKESLMESQSVKVIGKPLPGLKDGLTA